MKIPQTIVLLTSLIITSLILSIDIFIEKDYSKSLFFIGTSLVFYWCLYNTEFITSKDWKEYNVIKSTNVHFLAIGFALMMQFILSY